MDWVRKPVRQQRVGQLPGARTRLCYQFAFASFPILTRAVKAAGRIVNRSGAARHEHIRQTRSGSARTSRGTMPPARRSPPPYYGPETPVPTGFPWSWPETLAATAAFYCHCSRPDSEPRQRRIYCISQEIVHSQKPAPCPTIVLCPGLVLLPPDATARDGAVLGLFFSWILRHESQALGVLPVSG